MSTSRGFVAYPSVPTSVGETLRIAIQKVNSRAPNLNLSSWEENDIYGRSLSDPIFSKINESSIVIADITKLNFNVTFEIGYSIAVGKRVFLCRNRAIDQERELTIKVGIFDTLGYFSYENSDDLANEILKISDYSPLELPKKSDSRAPLYLLETPMRSEAMMRIVARVKKARLQYRSFSPSEDSRLSATDAIKHVSASHGVLVPLLSATEVDSKVHNLRCAFVAGLSHGLGKETLILQHEQGPVPLDVRDFAKTYKRIEDIHELIVSFALSVFISLQVDDPIDVPEQGRLANVVIGDPMAENEFQTLGKYYLRTDAFTRTLRGEVNIVVGRKGSGKTALFSQVRNQVRNNRANVVLDLKPEGYQLIKLKEQVLDYLSDGAKGHLITAFWEYILYLEICAKLLEKDSAKHLADHQLYEGYRKLQDLYHPRGRTEEGDFSERLLRISESVVDAYALKFGQKDSVRLTNDEVTSLLYTHDLKELRENVSDYIGFKKSVWVLFDNLDRGWSSQGLAGGDILILRCLIDAARKIQREMVRDGHEFHAVVFIRNDVYQLLMSETPDFGKEMRTSLDWNDPDLLREMLRRRLVQNGFPDEAEFRQVWQPLCVSLYGGTESSQYFIERSLMRPRNLLKIVAHCRGFAVNLGHQRIEPEDIEKGLRAYSNDLLLEADLELSDIDPQAEGLIYQFIGEESRFNYEQLAALIVENGIDNEAVDRVVEFLLYYGFIGIILSDGDPIYIYDVAYDMKILQTRMKKNANTVRFALNPAFWPALDTHHSESQRTMHFS